MRGPGEVPSRTSAVALAAAGAATWLAFFALGFLPVGWMEPIPVPLRIFPFFVLSAVFYDRAAKRAGIGRNVKLRAGASLALSVATFLTYLPGLDLIGSAGLLFPR